MSKCKRDGKGSFQPVIMLYLLMAIGFIGLLSFFCLLNGLSQQAHRDSRYHSQESAEDYNRGVEDGFLGYYLFRGSKKGRYFFLYRKTQKRRTYCPPFKIAKKLFH